LPLRTSTEKRWGKKKRNEKKEQGGEEPTPAHSNNKAFTQGEGSESPRREEKHFVERRI